MVQIRVRRDLTGHDAVAVWEEGVGPLLQQAVQGGEYVGGRRGEIKSQVIPSISSNSGLFVYRSLLRCRGLKHTQQTEQ
jgi:hypothetical protein